MPIFDRDHADSPEKAYVYILRCADGTLYCGWTNDLAARLDAHNSGKGAKYTRGRGPVELAYSEMFDTQSEAMHREAEIKKLTRPQKQALLDSQTGGEMPTVPAARVRAASSTRRVCATMSAICGSWACVTACAASGCKNGRTTGRSIPASTT